MPNDVDDAYQVFVNGQQIGEFGRFGKSGVKTYSVPAPRICRAGGNQGRPHHRIASACGWMRQRN